MSTIKAIRYMRLPFIVTAVEVTDENMDAIAKWCEGHVIRETDNSFVRVPVNHTTNKRQTEAYPGMFVVLSVAPSGFESFRIYTKESLEKNFIQIPREPEDVLEPPAQTTETPCCRQDHQHNRTARPLPSQKGARPAFRQPTS